MSTTVSTRTVKIVQAVGGWAVFKLNKGVNTTFASNNAVQPQPFHTLTVIPRYCSGSVTTPLEPFYKAIVFILNSSWQFQRDYVAFKHFLVWQTGCCGLRYFHVSAIFAKYNIIKLCSKYYLKKYYKRLDEKRIKPVFTQSYSCKLLRGWFCKILIANWDGKFKNV